MVSRAISGERFEYELGSLLDNDDDDNDDGDNEDDSSWVWIIWRKKAISSSNVRIFASVSRTLDRLACNWFEYSMATLS